MDIKVLREEFARLHTEAQTFLDASKEQTDINPDQQVAQDARFARMDQIEKLLKDQEKLAGYKFENGAVEVTTKSADQVAVEVHDRKQFSKELDLVQFNRDAGVWAGTGTPSQTFATITSATQSGALMPKVVVDPIVATAANVFRQAHELTGVPVVSTPNTATISQPVVGISAGGKVAEDASSETENAPTFTESFSLTCETFQSGSAWFSGLELAANNYDLVGSILPELVYAKELGLESEITSDLIADSAITQIVRTSTVTVAGLTFPKMQELNRKLPKRYDMQKVIILGSEAFNAVEGQVDTVGQPIMLSRDPQDQTLIRFNGTPVLRSDYFEAFGANKTIGVCISLRGFRLRDAAEQKLYRYDREKAKPDQIGLNLVSYHAAGWAPSCVVKLKTAIS